MNSNTQSERRNALNENINSDNEMKLSDGRVYDVNDIKDPVKRQGKGRTVGNRLKAYNEAGSSKIQKENAHEEDLENGNNGDNTNGLRCGLCHKTGHYAPRCPNKKSQ